jgi:hypothetical protein
MATNYTPDPTAEQPPSPAPNLDDDDVNPVLRFPQDGVDGLRADAWYQALKTLGDWLVAIKRRIRPLKGIRLWSESTTYTLNDYVVDPADGVLYRALDTSINWPPHENPGKWRRMGYDIDETRALVVAFTEATDGFTLSNGGQIAHGVTMLAFNQGVRKMITFEVQSVPANGTVLVDLRNCAVKLAGYVVSAHATLSGGGSAAYGGSAGINYEDGEVNRNLFTVWWRRGAGDSGATARVSVSIVGY